MWTLWLYISAIFAVSYGTILDIECGTSIVDIASAEQPVSLRFTNDYERDISLIDSNSAFIPVLKIKDSEGLYIDSISATDCVEKECDGKVYTMKAVQRGVYTVEMIPNDEGGEFKVDMMCSGDLFGKMKGMSTTNYVMMSR